MAERTQDFLDGLDPEFFSYLLDVHSASKDQKRASVGIRLALHHATETLFHYLVRSCRLPTAPMPGSRGAQTANCAL